jgi:2-succinyl-5-enolpyruvyl-6-hydroxy-3-cyclohexene-1-carboxylate synthase
MNGLLASRHEVNLTIVVINNGGGGIFSFLPIAESGVESFSQYWTTDTGLSIEKVAELYNSKYYLADNLQGLEKSIIDSFTIKGVKIIEVKTTIQENIKAHNRLSDIIKVALSDD